ncbi:MAG: RCC1 domain-containing protein, partial [Pseudobdellovibrionaceae bacterium]|nr:RCC1 domain-containing protein [Pseudobdellovibrionaceae bacterium]
AEALALGEKHSCAQLVNGSVWCWGAGEFLGSDTRGGLIPLKVPLPAAAISIVAGLDRSCAQLVNGEFACWASEPETMAIPN